MHCNLRSSAEDYWYFVTRSVNSNDVVEPYDIDLDRIRSTESLNLT